MGKVPRFLAALLLPVLVAVAAAPTPPPAREAAYPGSMAALGDSITQANNACCGPGDRPENSWSTGDGPGDGVASHYERLLRLDPAVRGNNANLSVSGAKVSDLPRQAAQAAESRVDYVTVLAGANDLCAPSAESMTPVEGFRLYVAEALETLGQLRPRPRILVASIPNLYGLWSALRNDPAAQAAWSGSGICQPMLAPSNTEDMRQQVVQRQLAFNLVLAETCGKYPTCRTDGGAVFAHVPSPGDVSTLDYFHPSIQGQAALADITWKAAWQG